MDITILTKHNAPLCFITTVEPYFERIFHNSCTKLKTSGNSETSFNYEGTTGFGKGVKCGRNKVPKEEYCTNKKR